jgi:putative transposase
MARQAQPITPSTNETRSLKTLLTRGTASARTLSRPRILDLPHRGQSPADIATLLQVSKQTAYYLKRRYLTADLRAALYDKPRSGRPIEISGSQRAKITALACSTPPEGRARWTPRLLADEAVEVGHCRPLSHTKARHVLKKTNPDRTRIKLGALALWALLSSHAWSRFSISTLYP